MSNDSLTHFFYYETNRSYYFFDDDFKRGQYVAYDDRKKSVKRGQYGSYANRKKSIINKDKVCRRISEHRLNLQNCNSVHELGFLQSGFTYLG
jgi:hypothetical protein